jgi:hypothetical protein
MPTELNLKVCDDGKVKVKLSLCFKWAPRHEGVLGGAKVQLHPFLTSALDGGEWSASCPGRSTPGKEPRVPTG